MEKAKRKHSPEITQKRLTRTLMLILGLSILIFFFPLAWLDNSSEPPLQLYALFPLLSIPYFIFYWQQGPKKHHVLLLLLCLLMSYILFTHLAPCGCNGGYSFYRLANSSVGIHMGCGYLFIYCLF